MRPRWRLKVKPPTMSKRNFRVLDHPGTSNLTFPWRQERSGPHSRTRRFELYYWDYIWGIVFAKALTGPFTPGRFWAVSSGNWGHLQLCRRIYPMLGPGTSFSLGEGKSMISAVWRVFVWKEFRGPNRQVKCPLALMFALLVPGLVSISPAPVFE